jgi:hypothetical protein
MTAFGIGEVAPSAGLAPRTGDLFPAAGTASLEAAICAQLGLPDIAIVGTGTAAIRIALTYLARRSPQRRTVRRL